MKVTHVHTHRRLTLTILQLTFSLVSLSVSNLCYIHKPHYDCSHCGPLKPNKRKPNC